MVFISITQIQKQDIIIQNGGTVTSNSNGKTHRIVIDAAGNIAAYIDGQVTYLQTGLSTDQYKVYIAHNSSTNKPLENVALRTANYPLSCELDTDNDGTPNGLDLDSVGDGCIDTIEAGTSDDGTTTDANNNVSFRTIRRRNYGYN